MNHMHFGLAYCLASLITILMSHMLTVAAGAQGAISQEMDQWLNQVDNPANWQSAPNLPQSPPYRTTLPYKTSGQTSTNYQANSLATPSRAPITQSKLLPGRARVVQQNPFKLSRQEILRIMLGGSNNAMTKNPNAVYGARDNLQLASDAAAQAESACSRAYYAGNRDEALSAAAEAQNQANVARAAADRATQAASDGSSEAKDAASAAHSESSRAQAAADRAAAHAHGATW
ncbi:MAG: hypothetical protein HY711_02880 [Candidatus Melainabacteria bacterium]|nr:hypothetical protein [Candidatus Melainabacteria bacterium]